jgi:peptidoglycan glycosyltransferase
VTSAGSGRHGSGTGGAPGIATALLRVGLALTLVYSGLVVGMGWWQVVQAGPLTNDPANPLTLAAERNAPRGRILDSQGQVVAVSVREAGAEPRRRYPHPAMAPIVGYKSLLFGTAGLENTYDGQLTGLQQLGPGDEVLRKFRSDPYDPSELHLSVDARFQEAALKALGTDRGAVVAIEPKTGRILALVSNPTYDPNRLVDPATARSYLQTLRADKASPLLNRSTQGRYVPGSVFKMVTAVAALDSGSIAPETTYADQPRQYRTGFRVAGFDVHDAPRTVQLDHPLNFYEATEVSCNIWFAHAGLSAGPANYLAAAARLGFGHPIDFELPTVASQVTGGGGPFGGFQDKVELANAAYGQGEALVTPLQMALVAGAIADGGTMMAPRLVDKLVSDNGSVQNVESHVMSQAMSSTTSAEITRAMVRAVNGPFAAGYAGAAAVPGVLTAGKSGTAQLASGSRPHSWFIGFAPADNPQIAIAVIAENAGLGSQHAVPIGGQLMRQFLQLARG